MTVQSLDLADFLLIAEAVLGIKAEVLMRSPSVIALGESALAAPAASYGGVEFYPDFSRKAAVFCARLAKNHPLPDGNKRVAYLCLVEFVERNGYTWEPGDAEEAAQAIEAVASSQMTETAFAEWVRARIQAGGVRPGP